MDIDFVPLEILQEILGLLPYEDLLQASLVCQRWKAASDSVVVRNGSLHIGQTMVGHLGTVRGSERRYQSIVVHKIDDWPMLRPVLRECSQRFTPKSLHLAGFLEDYMYEFYLTHRHWMDSVESLRVQMDDRFSDYLTYGSEEHTLEFPNLKHLIWRECLYSAGNKTVIIIAPKLESVYLDDSLDATAVLRIPSSDKLKHIRCTLYTKHFVDTFTGRFPNLETLILDFAYGNYDLSFFGAMRNLRWIELSIYHNELVQGFEAVYNCTHLLGLRLNMKDCPSKRLAVDLNRILESSPKMQKIEFCWLDIKIKSSVRADHLVQLKLKDVRFHNSGSMLSISAPKLQTLTLPVEMLPKVHVDNNSCLSRLFVDLRTVSLKESLELYLCPFVRLHNSVKDLTLSNADFANPFCDESRYENLKLDVEKLELRTIDVGISFFQLLSKWNSLKHLSLVGCTIGCRGGAEVYLPSLEAMVIDFVKLKGTSRTSFPIIAKGIEDVTSRWIAPTLVFSTENLVHKDIKVGLFDCSEIDPL